LLDLHIERWRIPYQSLAVAENSALKWQTHSICKRSGFFGDEAMFGRNNRRVRAAIVICTATLILACAGCVCETVTDERGTTRRYYRPSILEFFQWDGSMHFRFGDKIRNDAP
jgi:hypothetical protein